MLTAKSYKLKANLGFTLAELLIVISIITVLTIASLFGFNRVQERARDARRISDIQALRTALEMYYRENHRYPGGETNVSVPANRKIPRSGQFIGVGDHCQGTVQQGCTSWGSIDEELAPYISPIPRDPRHDGVNFYYAYDPEHQYNPPVSATNGRYVTCGSDPTAHASYPGHAVMIGFRTAESNTSLLERITCSGEDQNLHSADYTLGMFPTSP